MEWYRENIIRVTTQPLDVKCVPYQDDQSAEAAAAFAEAELGALVLHGGTGLNTGLPLTDNQKARQNQLREGRKKRAAAAIL